MARVAQVEQQATHSVALNLAPLLVPHRKQGRLSLRVERMPQGTRLTRGTRNNDNTWSLASDELEDLAVQVPENQKAFKIGVRVISLINGSTLVTVDLPVNPSDGTASVPEPPTATVATTISPASAAELTVLRQELNAAKEKLASRDAELAERLAAAATESSNLFQQTLAKAEASWTQSENTRLAAIQQQWQDKFAEALSHADGAQKDAHDKQVRELQEKIAALQAVLDQRNASLEQARAASNAARERGDSAAKDAIAKLAGTEGKLAEVEGKLAGVEGHLAGVEGKLAQREAELESAVAAVDAAKREAETALAKAEHDWRNGEANRLAAAEAQWRENSAKALASAHANAQALHAKGTASEQDLASQIVELRAAVSEREAALTRAQAAHEQARAAAAQDTASERTAAEAKWKAAEAHWKAAEENWKVAEAARVAAVEAEWRTKLEDAVKAVVVEQVAPQPAPAPVVDDTELLELRDKVSALQAQLAMRDAAAQQAAKLSEEEHRRWQKEAQDVVVKAARERKSDENARVAALQSEWTKQSARELALATARAEAAESALTQLRLRAIEEAPMQRELASLRSALAIREAELEHYRPSEPTEDQPPANDTAEQPPAPNPATKRMVRDALIAACIGIAAVVAWPIVSAEIEKQSRAVTAEPAAAVVEMPAVVLSEAIANQNTKLRATPSLYGDVVGRLPRDVKVERLEVKGDWTRVHRTDVPPKGEPAEGWAKTETLSDAPAEPPAPVKRAKSKKKQP